MNVPPRPSARRLGAVLALLLAAPAALAQTGTVTGRVVDAENGQPLPGATVRLAAPERGGVERGGAADAFGRFVLRDVPAGPAVLTASFVGFVAAEQTATVADGETVALDFRLAEEDGRLAEVVVRSEKFVRNLQETQSSVAVVGDGALNALPIRDWRDAGLLVGNFSGNGVGGFVIRGINSAGVGFGGQGTTAQLYIDGIAQNQASTRSGARGTWDVEAVEVFRGPQSTVAGRNALAGAVSIRSKDPSFEYGAAARLRGGSQETAEGALMLTGPLVADQLAFRLSGELQREDTGFRYTALEDEGFDLSDATENGYASAKARLLFTPTALPGFSARLAYGYAYDRPNIYFNANGPDFEARESTSPFTVLDDNRTHNVSLEAAYDLTDALTITSLTGYLANERTYDSLEQQDSDPDVVIPVGQRSVVDGDDVTQELRLNVVTDRTTAVVGGYAGRFAFSGFRVDRGDVFPIVEGNLTRAAVQLGLIPAGASLPPFEVLYETDNPLSTESVNVALFGEVNHEVLPDRLTLTAGLRYDYEEYEERSEQDATISLPDSPFDAATTALVVQTLQAQIESGEQNPSASYNALLPKLGATLDVTPDLSLGAVVQRGYRAGGAEVLTTGQRNVYDPEYTWNYELALRSRWLGGRLTANANAFYTDWTDQQVRIPVEGTTLTQTVNAGASTLYGAEIELRAVAARGLTVFGSGGLVHTEFDEFVLAGRDLAGYQFPASSGETVSLGAVYEPGSGPFAALSASYTGPFYDDVGTLPDGGNDPLLRAGDYTIVNGQVGYAFGLRGVEARVAAFARNLLDEDIATRRTFDSFGQPVVRFSLPRVIGLSLDVSI
ncbi:TonB-dependent receptor [Rubrivirga sp. S365]|uniref:TonB-dependent receptor n=1 Tax=Rubrivirga litoralis TaxID=3075598 RepID=A0ABU3BU15_9BACT|nr:MULTISPECIES: TonB-dependent receptor [unclassified Rubrivirga]MDT0632779.1 TonB-dependent receptor [Rubrivirga sp. F394]MDT7855181.1 TonB-dependent receptor [Rubrivirga sp. S365]